MGVSAAFRLKLFSPAQASIRVSSTVKCSADKRSRSRACANTLVEEGPSHVPFQEPLPGWANPPSP
jgi:hypothetical protein